MPAMKSMPDLPQRGARVSLHQPVTRTLSTFPTNPSKKKVSVFVRLKTGEIMCDCLISCDGVEYAAEYKDAAFNMEVSRS